MAARSSGSSTSPEDPSKVLKAVEALVRAQTHGLRTEVKWNNAWRAGQDLVLCYAAFARHVGIEFWRGTSLPDPAHLLEGTGKNLRHVKVRSIAEANARPLAALIRAAVKLDRTAPPRTR